MWAEAPARPGAAGYDVNGDKMLNKAKATKQELKKLDKGIDAANDLVALVDGLEKAIEARIAAVEFLDGGIRQELARTQLTIGLSRAHLRQLAQAGETYRTAQAQAGKAKPAKAKAKTKAKIKAAPKAKPAPKAKAAAKAKAPAKKKA